MKNIKIYLSLLLLPLLGLSACTGEFEQPPVILPEGGVGTGAWNDPMSCYQVNLGAVNDDIAEPWVTGYIVGWINTDISTVLKAEVAATTVPATVASNLLMAADPKETDWTKMISVQLPSGAVRNALNLKDHPENLGVQVTIKGTTGSKYCGVYGVRSVSAYNFGPEGKDDGSAGPAQVEAVPSLYCDFEASDNINTYVGQGWANVVTSGGLSGWFIKNYSNNNYASVNALKGTATGGPYEEWLIAPPVDLSKSPEKSVKFTCQSAYPADLCNLEVYAMTSNDPKSATLTKLSANIPTPPASGYSAWAESNIDLSQFSGVVYIGWKYRSEHGGGDASSTYCIDNVNIGGATVPGGNGGGQTPDIPSGSESTVFSSLSGTSANGAEGWNYEIVSNPAGLDYIWTWKDYNGSYYLNASAYANSSANASEAYAVSPEISLSGYTGVSMTFEHAAKFQTTLRTLCGVCVREVGTTAWTPVAVPVWPEAGSWTFVSAGSLDLSAFAGKKVQVAFKYASSASGADTWEIKNLKVTGSK